jgi:hypothetical protein
MNSDASNKSTHPDADTRPPSLTEAEFLQQEVARARTAIGNALSDLGQNLKATADPRHLTRDHPWVAISSAAVAGFAAAVTLIPSKQQQALRALAELERARHAPPPSTAPPSDNSAPSGSILGTITAEVLKTIRPLFTALLSAGIAKATSNSTGAAPSNPAPSNGHSEEEQISTPS